MKVKFVDVEKIDKHIPEIGQAWKHDIISNNIFIRISDTAAELFPSNQSNDYFYSCELGSGRIVFTAKHCDNIINLEPVDGVMAFEDENN